MFMFQAEKLSMGQLLDVLLIFVMAAIWFYMPNDGLAIVTQWFYNKVMAVSIGSCCSLQIQNNLTFLIFNDLLCKWLSTGLYMW